MAKRTTGTERQQRNAVPAIRAIPSGIERQAVVLAEQVGRVAGTIHAKTDQWLDQKALAIKLTRIRDGAADLLERLSRHSGPLASSSKRPSAGKGTKAPQGRSGGKVDAPGKKHRKAPTPKRGVKHSEQSIAKAIGAQQARLRRKG